MNLLNKTEINCGDYKKIITDNDKRVVKFIEKPKVDQITTNVANAGICVYNKEILRFISELDSIQPDIGKDLFPLLLSHGEFMFVYEMTEFLLDIGTMETYNLAQEKIKELIL